MAPRGHNSRTHGMSHSPEYRALSSAVGRCHRPKNAGYKYYGARGIRVCDAWRGPGGFERFFAHIGPRPAGTTIDRIKRHLGYEPGNVRWASAKLQSDNRIIPHMAGGDGKRMLPFGFRATQRMLDDIRTALESAFGAPEPERLDPASLHVETAFVECDYGTRNEHIEGIDDLRDLLPRKGTYIFPFHPGERREPRERSRFGKRGPYRTPRRNGPGRCSVCSSIGHNRLNCPVRRKRDKELDAKLDRELKKAERARLAEQRRADAEAKRVQREYSKGRAA